MPQNPFTDAWQFLIGATDDHLQLGGWRYLFVVLFLALLAAALYLAVRNWQEDPAQRTGRNLGIGTVRILIGCMWSQSVLWKLPLPVSGGLQFWTEQMANRAAFEFHREFVSGFLIPNLHFFGPLVFLTELMLAVSFLLGFGVRFAGIIGMLFVLHLWLGIYLPGDPAEWPWSYVFLVMVMFLLVLDAAGRSLGLDAWLRRNVPAVRDGTGFLGRLLRTVG
jgi:uncharacterized membrane protein YphA (DoxX/SURF4 family)